MPWLSTWDDNRTSDSIHFDERNKLGSVFGEYGEANSFTLDFISQEPLISVDEDSKCFILFNNFFFSPHLSIIIHPSVESISWYASCMIDWLFLRLPGNVIDFFGKFKHIGLLFGQEKSDYDICPTDCNAWNSFLWCLTLDKILVFHYKDIKIKFALFWYFVKRIVKLYPLILL